jgi:hypothetical protein
MVQRIESLMKDLGPQGIKAVKIDTDACPDLASQLKVCFCSSEALCYFSGFTRCSAALTLCDSANNSHCANLANVPGNSYR